MQPEDCDLLHAGLDEMRKNTNPFTGGINFDESWLNSTSCSTRFYLSDQETLRALLSCKSLALHMVTQCCFSWKVQRCDAVCEPKADLTSWFHHAPPYVGPGALPQYSRDELESLLENC